MSLDDLQQSYWLDLFTEETWLEAARHGFSVSGFSDGRWATVQRVKRGDMLICYLTIRSAYVGLLRVTGEAYRDEAPIWSSQVFPSRLPVEPELLLRPDGGIPVRSLSDQLSYFRRMSDPKSNAWTGHFRGSPALIAPDDAAVIVEALSAAAGDSTRVLRLDNVPQPVPRRKSRRKLEAPSEAVSTSSSPVKPSRTPKQETPVIQSSPVTSLEPEEVTLGRHLVDAAMAGEMRPP